MYRNPWKRRAKFISVGLILLLIVLGVVSVIPDQPANRDADMPVFRELPTGESTSLGDAVNDVFRLNKLGEVEDYAAETEGNWAFIAVTPQNIGEDGHEAMIVLGNLENGKWKVALAGSTVFQKWLVSVPDSLMSEETKNFFRLK